jgi:uncharacterized protein (TIGR00255 family)
VLKSMTSFGKGICDTEKGRFVIEVQSLNRKFLEVNINFPKGYALLEPQIRKQVSKKIKRGKVNIYLSVDYHPASTSLLSVNMALAEQLVNAYRGLKEKLGLSGDVDLSMVAQNRDIIKLDEEQLASEEYWSGISDALKEALGNAESMRTAEGKEIEQDFRSRLESISKQVEDIDKLAPEAVVKFQQRLVDRVKAVAESTDGLDDRIRQEIAIFAEKADISEEIVRLRSHTKQFLKFLESDDVVGRSLEFLVQEMNREVNTIGSKSSNVTISNLVVDIKSGLEKIREQVQNIE